MRYKFLIIFAMLLGMSHPAQAAIHGETVEYKQDNAVLEGYLAYDDASQDKRPGVLVVHDWLGNGDYSKFRAEELAKLGYVAFAADIYGKGVRPKNAEEAAKVASIYKNDRSLMRARVQAALDVLKSNALVTPDKIAAIGYCFGGTTVLELARSGADIAGVVSFHGGLDTTQPATNSIKAKVLALHGADDPFVPSEQVQMFQKEMNDAGADWQMVYYSGAVHSFTRKDAGDDKSKGVAYNEKADHRSWQAMKDFFSEIFK
jgi:dienelactone hydrolase